MSYAPTFSHIFGCCLTSHLRDPLICIWVTSSNIFTITFFNEKINIQITPSSATLAGGGGEYPPMASLPLRGDSSTHTAQMHVAAVTGQPLMAPGAPIPMPLPQAGIVPGPGPANYPGGPVSPEYLEVMGLGARDGSGCCRRVRDTVEGNGYCGR